MITLPPDTLIHLQGFSFVLPSNQRDMSADDVLTNLVSYNFCNGNYRLRRLSCKRIVWSAAALFEELQNFLKGLDSFHYPRLRTVMTRRTPSTWSHGLFKVQHSSVNSVPCKRPCPQQFPTIGRAAHTASASTIDPEVQTFPDHQRR